MGSWLSCMEKGTWDHVHHVKSRYKPLPGPKQDMTKPLSNYFISSGHNSYLQGNQLTSTAGTDTIEVGLRTGCRVVELDVYDGPTEPVVTHGGTLTSTVTFRECVKAVAKLGFTASPYPVILTIENHVQQQQDQMVSILKTVLGSHLFVPTPGQLEREGQWLSPEALKHKVVVRMKVKPGTTESELAALVYICNSSIRSYDVTAGVAVPSSHSLPDSKLPQVPEYAGFTAASKLFSFRTSQAAQAAKEAEAGMDPVDIAAEFAAAASRPPAEAAAASGPDAAARNKEKVKDQAVRPAATTAAAEGGASGAPKLAQPVRSFRLSFEDVRQEETLEEELDDTLRSASSLSAGALEGNVSKPDLAAVLQYTSKHLLRCYPSAWRMLDNSNPNPAAAWSFGVSLAALNWQLWDPAVWVNMAFFQQQNNSGYVLKPQWMLSVDPQQPVPAREPKILKVHVYSAFRPQGMRVGVFKDDLYVELRVIGMPHDAATQSSPHTNNTACLVLNQDFSFDVKFPELAVLMVLLKDQDSVLTDTVLGYAALPLANLAEGAFSLPLADPYKMGGDTRHTGMWIKVTLAWA